MDIIKLPVGKRAPRDSDCISIDEQPDGQFNLTGSLLVGDESVAIVSPILCATREEAEAQGTSWAGGCGIEQLYVATTLRDTDQEDFSTGRFELN